MNFLCYFILFYSILQHIFIRLWFYYFFIVIDVLCDIIIYCTYLYNAWKITIYFARLQSDRVKERFPVEIIKYIAIQFPIAIFTFSNIYIYMKSISRC